MQVQKHYRKLDGMQEVWALLPVKWPGKGHRGYSRTSNEWVLVEVFDPRRASSRFFANSESAPLSAGDGFGTFSRPDWMNPLKW